MRYALALGLVLALGSNAAAHIALTSPPPRTSEQKAGPCGATGSTRSANVTAFAAGETITVEWNETVGHPGHYRIAFDDDGNDAFQNPSTPDDNFAFTLVDQITDRDGETHYTQTVTLPSTPCANCTLQLMQVMTTAVPYNSFYYQCADITIGDAPPGDGDIGGGCQAGSGSGSGFGALLLVGLLLRRRRRCPQARLPD